MQLTAVLGTVPVFLFRSLPGGECGVGSFNFLAFSSRPCQRAQFHEKPTEMDQRGTEFSAGDKATQARGIPRNGGVGHSGASSVGCTRSCFLSESATGQLGMPREVILSLLDHHPILEYGATLVLTKN